MTNEGTLNDVLNDSAENKQNVEIPIPDGTSDEAIDLRNLKPNPTPVPEKPAAGLRAVSAAGMSSAELTNAGLRPASISEILPPKKEEPDPMSMELVSNLNAAIEREKKSISERINAIGEAQKKELEEEAKEHEEAELDRELGFTPRQHTDDYDDITDLPSDSDDDDDDVYVDNSKFASSSYAPNPNVEIHSTTPEENTPVEVETEVVPEEEDVVDVGDEVPDRVKSEYTYHNTNESELTIDPTPKVDWKVDEATLSEPVTEADPEPEVIEQVKEPVVTSEVREAPTTAPHIQVESTVPETVTLPVSSDDDKEFDDLFGDDDEDDATETNDDGTVDQSDEEILEDLKKEVKSKITMTAGSVDLTKFTISTKAANAQKLMKAIVKNNLKVADWVLLSAERPISVSALSGSDILKMNPQNSTRNRLNTLNDMYRTVYEHIVDGNKPSYEVWLRQTKFVDIPHLQFALYKATFANSNYVAYTCPNDKCKHIFIQDVPFDSMVKYADDGVRKKVQDILRLDTTTKNNDSYKSDLVQISANYAFSIRTPSIYSLIIETASLPDDFLNKHSDFIDMISYIDNIYYIDMASQQLRPIDTKPDPNNQTRTAARRVKIFHDIIKSLSSEEFYRLRMTINEYGDDKEEITYVVPGTKCPKCGTEIPEDDTLSPNDMLFQRHQLAAIANMSNT